MPTGELVDAIASGVHRILLVEDEDSVRKIVRLSLEKQGCQVVECASPELALKIDPPLPEFGGKARIMNCVEGFVKPIAGHRSPANQICFCLGTFAAMGVDISATIRRLGSYIGYVHFRDVRGHCREFVETFHDNGPTDMAKAVRALRQVGYSGYMRPYRVPQLTSEEAGEPGYTMLGRLFAFGYVRGLLHGTSSPDQ